MDGKTVLMVSVDQLRSAVRLIVAADKLVNERMTAGDGVKVGAKVGEALVILEAVKARLRGFTQ